MKSPAGLLQSTVSGTRSDNRGIPSGVLMIVWHSRTGASRAMANAAREGAGDIAAMARADEVQPDQMLEADGYLFVCPENLASMSGMMKEMFDRCYYPLLGNVEGRPYATIISAGSDGTGAQAQIDRIVTGWRLKRVAPHMIVNFDAQTPEAILAKKEVPESALEQSGELGVAMAEGLRMGIF